MKFSKLGMAATILATFVAVNASTPASAAEPLTVDQCIAIALSESPAIKIADMEVTRVDYSKKDALGQLLPSVNFSGSYSRTLAKQTMYMNMGAFAGLGGGSSSGTGSTDGDSSDSGTGTGSSASSGASSAAASSSSKPSGIKVGLDNSYSVGFSASMPLIAPQLWKALELSDVQILRNVEAARQSRLALVNQVKSAFYALLLAKDSQKVIQESYDMAALTHEIYKKKYAAGAASDYDVLRTSVAMKNVEPELLQAEVTIKKARLQLLILMGVDASFPLEVAGNLQDYEATMYADALTLSGDYSGNTDLLLNEIDMKLLDKQISMRKAAFYPTLALSFNYNWTSMNNGTPFKSLQWNPYSMAGITLSMPLFTGGTRYNAVKVAQVQLNEMRLQRENLERTVAMKVDIARDNIKINVQQIASCSESVGQAERAHDIMEKSFNIGATSYLELRDSELALTRARLAYYQAIFNYLVAGSELELLLGNAPLDSYTLNN